jgi:hypothetical protein
MARHLELEMQSELSVDYVKAVAGIFQASGYFGDRSVDQLATLIFVGDALGLKPANAVFDLEVKDGAIQYKAAEAFRKAADQVDGLKAEIDDNRLVYVRQARRRRASLRNARILSEHLSKGKRSV